MDQKTAQLILNEAKLRKEKILNLRKHVMTIVEDLIEPEVNKTILIENCKYLCQSDYYDVTVERSIQNYCGYPICSSSLSDLSKKRQKFKICLKTHQVFDITDRKMFCSNLCFTSSNYLKNQLEEQPLWMRETTNTNKRPPVNLYEKSKGTLGDEVELDINLTKDLIRELHKEGDSLNLKLYCQDCCFNQNQDIGVDKKIVKCKNKNCLTNKTTGVRLNKSISFPYIQQEDLDSLKDKLSNLKIKEKRVNNPNNRKQSIDKKINEPMKPKVILDKVVEKTDKINLKSLN